MTAATSFKRLGIAITAVVVASFATLALALLNPDPIVDAPLAASKSELPAVAARNHLAAARR